MASILAVAALAGCSMSTPWWIQRGLRDSGFTRAQARCVTRGVSDNLSGEQLWSLREAVIGLPRPVDGVEVSALVARLQPTLAPEVHHVVAHYVGHCRAGG
jgi:hypothetical protein